MRGNEGQNQACPDASDLSRPITAQVHKYLASSSEEIIKVCHLSLTQPLDQKMSQQGKASQIFLLQMAAAGSLGYSLPQGSKDPWVRASYRLLTGCMGPKRPPPVGPIASNFHLWTGSGGTNGCGSQDNYFPFQILGPPNLSLFSSLDPQEPLVNQFLSILLHLYVTYGISIHLLKLFS